MPLHLDFYNNNENLICLFEYGCKSLYVWAIYNSAVQLATWKWIIRKWKSKFHLVWASPNLSSSTKDIICPSNGYFIIFLLLFVNGNVLHHIIMSPFCYSWQLISKKIQLHLYRLHNLTPQRKREYAILYLATRHVGRGI